MKLSLPNDKEDQWCVNNSLQKIQSWNLEISSMPEGQNDLQNRYDYHEYKKSQLLQFVCP